MHFGPRFDHTCMVVRTNNEKFILSAGGWNNSAMHETEIFSVKNERWMPVKFTSGVTADDPPKNIYADSLVKGLRSSKMASIKNIPLLAGGVECDGYVCIFFTVFPQFRVVFLTQFFFTIFCTIFFTFFSTIFGTIFYHNFLHNVFHYFSTIFYHNFLHNLFPNFFTIFYHHFFLNFSPFFHNFFHFISNFYQFWQ